MTDLEAVEVEVTAETTPPTFAELGVAADICAALAEQGIETAFPIQAQALPLALEGRDVIGQAKTGTGKTLAFGLPILQQVTQADPPPSSPAALIVVPTRELATQVSKDLTNANPGKSAKVLAIYGGKGYEPQIEALEKGANIVVGTPGRLIDLMQQKHLKLEQVDTLVLDEADEMLDMGFFPDVEKLVAALPNDRQTMLFSATMPGPIMSLARNYMTKPIHVRAADEGDSDTVVDRIEQHIWRAHSMDKPNLVARVLQAPKCERAIIFSRTKRSAQTITDDLVARGFKAEAIHGDLGQAAREKALKRFREGQSDILVATDVAARGIDIDGVTHVINYQCPDDEKTYVHRIGRTGRAGADGVALTLVDWEDTARWQMINRALKLAFHEPVETYSTSPTLTTVLGVPEDAKATLPGAPGPKDKKPSGDRNRRSGDRNRGGKDGSNRNRNRKRNDDRSGNSGSGSGSENQDKPKVEREKSTERDGQTRRRRRRRKPASDKQTQS